MNTGGITAALHCTPLLSVREGLSLSLSAHTANFSCQVQLPECTREIGCLYSFSFSSLLIASLSFACSFSHPLHTWLPDLFYLSAGGNTNPNVFFLLILFFDDVLQIHLADYRAAFLGLKAARMYLKTRLRCIPLVKQVLSASNRLNFPFFTDAIFILCLILRQQVFSTSEIEQRCFIHFIPLLTN